jgi:hypothetical protein
MALPASLSTCTVEGTYVNLIGNPISGSVTFTPQTILKETTLNVILMPTPIVKTLDATGSLTLTLPCTSDTDVVPQPFIYTVVENFVGGRTTQIALPLSVANTTQNLADLLPAVTTAESASYVTLDQYQALLTRYTADELTRTIVVNAEDYDENSATYSTATANIATELVNFTAKQLMLMGV